LSDCCLPDWRSATAAFRSDVGHGRAVLTGVHDEVSGAQSPIEVSSCGEDSVEHGMRLRAELARCEPERCRCFANAAPSPGVLRDASAPGEGCEVRPMQPAAESSAQLRSFQRRAGMH
jgi:hypothetical protein